MSLNCLVASPPYAGSINTPDDTVKRAQRMLDKGITQFGHVRVHAAGFDNMSEGQIGGFNTTYGNGEGQLGSMREGMPTTGATKLKRIKHYDWTGLYDQSWKGVIVPGAFVHPAKYSRALIRRIYEFMFEQKWLKAGDTVIDPFGGVGLGALDAQTMGLNWTGIELEPRFVALGQENIALWDKRYRGKLPRWGTARIVQGDSRHLLDVIAQAGAVCSSPPYAGDVIRDRSPELEAPRMKVKGLTKAKYGMTGGEHTQGTAYGTTPGQLAALREGDVQSVIASPPFIQTQGGEKGIITNGLDRSDGTHQNIAPRTYNSKNTGDAPGQLARMPEGIIASPPYSAARVGDECGQEHVGHNGNYGTSAGQLGAMAEGVVTSPPYEGTPVSQTHMTSNKRGDPTNPNYRPSWKTKLDQGFAETVRPYGNGNGQLGETEGETFWSAARIIVAQAHAALAPGAHAAWVLKSFVRNKAIVDFPQQWQTLCESVGFETVAIARAWQTKDDGTQLATDGDHKRLTKERKGFFRRLHEKKYPNTKIDYEIVLFQVKPDAH